MSKLKLMLPVLAAIVGLAASAFTTFSGAKRANTTYEYVSTDQSMPARETASNYQKGSATCTGTGNECEVILNQDFGDTPDFTNVTFDSNGFPNGGSAFVSNTQKH